MYHKITIAGRLTRDPEMRYMQDGTAVTNLSLAVDDGWGDNKHTIWFRVSVWGRSAEVANQYLEKGRAVLIDGRLRADQSTGNPRTYTRQDGTVGTSYEITTRDITFLPGGGDSSGGGGNYSDGDSSSSGQNFGSTPVVEEDDIPF